jgi:hypothetical protein
MSATQARPAGSQAPALLLEGARPLARFADVARLAARLAPAPVGLACWANSMAGLNLDSIGLYGLLASVDAWFFVGLALLIVGFAAELSRSQRQLWILVLYVLATVVVIDATVPLLFHAPEYQWVYKHIGVTQSLKLNGQVTAPSNIYQAWPTFFSAMAAISSLSGASPVTFATWAPLFFELANCVVLIAIFKTMTRDSRVAILAVLLFECLVSWVGQDYFSPQAFAYLLWLGLILVVLRYLSGWAPGERSANLLNRLRGLLLRGFESRPAPSPGMRLAAVMATMTMFFVIVSSHQLTPYIALAGLASLAALGLLRPWWLLPMLAAIAAAFLLPRYHIVSSEYGGLFSGLNVVANASARVKVSEPAALFSEHIATGLAVVMWLVTLGLVARSVRSLGRVAVPAVLAFSPFVVLLVQSYGGEATYRVFLFSAPWCAYLIASAIMGLRFSPLRIAATALVPAVVLLAGLQALYGPVDVNAFTPAEVSASEWLYGHAPLGSTLMLADENFPTEETATALSYKTPLLPIDPQQGAGEIKLDTGNVAAVSGWAASQEGEEKFLVLSRSMAAYSAYFGFPAQYRRLAREIPLSPSWTLLFKNRDVSIYRFTPAVLLPAIKPAAAPAPAAAVPARIAPAARALAPSRPAAAARRLRARPRGTVSRR